EGTWAAGGFQRGRPGRAVSTSASSIGSISQIHDRDRATHSKDGDGSVEPQLAGVAFRRASDSDEGSDFKAALPGLAPDLLILVGEQLLAAVANEPGEEVLVPGFVDATGVRCRRPVRDTTRADDGDPLRHGLARTVQCPAEFVTPLQGYERR